MNLRFRHEWDRFETAAIFDALYKSHERHLAAGNPIAQVSDPAVAYRRIITGEQDALLADGYLVVFDVGPLWSGEKLVVNELYVCATSLAHGKLHSPVKALEAVAIARKAHGVCVGNASGDPRLDGFYTRLGYKEIGNQFYKEL
jgi:hypothetical protein